MGVDKAGRGDDNGKLVTAKFRTAAGGMKTFQYEVGTSVAQALQNTMDFHGLRFGVQAVTAGGLVELPSDRLHLAIIQDGDEFWLSPANSGGR